MKDDLHTLAILLPILIPLLLVQGTWMFLDARKRGESYYWLWGLWGLTSIPTPLIVYILVTRCRHIKCKNCGRGISEKWYYCPYCGAKLKEE
jgi:hypothetical protein